jgi:hypothetical protein
MKHEQDKWFESLTGRQTGDDQDQEASCLRRALLNMNEQQITDSQAGVDADQKLQELLDRLDRDGMLDDKTAQPSQRMGFRYAIAAALTVAIIAPLAYLVYQPAGVDVEHGGVGPTAKVQSQNVESIDRLSLARRMAEYGIDNQDALALVLSLNIYKGTAIGEFSTQLSSQTSTLETKTYMEYVRERQSDLLPRARQFAQGDTVLLAMVDDVEAEIMRGAGGKVYVGEVALNRSSQITLDFSGGELAAVYVEGDGKGDIDLFVYDEDENLICVDTDTADAGLCKWIPETDGLFILKINDTSPVEREYVLLTN